jgi:hypothetical protein
MQAAAQSPGSLSDPIGRLLSAFEGRMGGSGDLVRNAGWSCRMHMLSAQFFNASVLAPNPMALSPSGKK